MRQHKYRAWHPVAKKMYPVVTLDFNDEGVIVVALQTYEAEGMVYSAVCTANDVELLEYIGRQDTNGKDIYEGDVVRINHPADLTGDFTNALGVVWWDEEEAAWYHSNNHGRPPKRMWKYVEVIGNYYEHPDLADQLKQA